jgi:hypothetical protein
LEPTLIVGSIGSDGGVASGEEEATVLCGREAVEFTGDDADYLKWLDEHPGGFIINIRRHRSPQYMVLHKATCGIIKNTTGIPDGGYTTRSYIKICSTDLNALRAWGRRYGRPDGSFSKACDACKPLGGDGDTTRPVKVTEAALLIRINRLYREGMSELELYEATRGVWKLGDRRNRVRFAFAVFGGVVREVYEVEAWHPAGTTPYTTRTAEDVRERYVGRSVVSYLTPGSQNPLTYVNV